MTEDRPDAQARTEGTKSSPVWTTRVNPVVKSRLDEHSQRYMTSGQKQEDFVVDMLNTFEAKRAEQDETIQHSHEVTAVRSLLERIENLVVASSSIASERATADSLRITELNDLLLHAQAAAHQAEELAKSAQDIAEQQVSAYKVSTNEAQQALETVRAERDKASSEREQAWTMAQSAIATATADAQAQRSRAEQFETQAAQNEELRDQLSQLRNELSHLQVESEKERQYSTVELAKVQAETERLLQLAADELHRVQSESASNRTQLKADLLLEHTNQLQELNRIHADELAAARAQAADYREQLAEEREHIARLETDLYKAQHPAVGK